ncbi:hypothetical protein IGI04_037445 [Brassica rapa subsp. trilocularis]|uniref:Transmembrane protein n=1 Tax=Brassica rapa subsp. trilocularis TaxID=1813537 RepID=A0ABQ7LK19_BRACM|nr:hypothetical protein IGI04_037445 [Brassica rapa subsp. trilocularis]
MMFLLLLLKVVQVRLLRMELRQNLDFIAAEYEDNRLLLWSGSRNVALEIISFGLIMYRVLILGKRKMCTQKKKKCVRIRNIPKWLLNCILICLYVIQSMEHEKMVLKHHGRSKTQELNVVSTM